MLYLGEISLSPFTGYIFVAAGEALIEQHYAVITIEHQIPRVDLSRLAGVSRKFIVHIEIFFVPVQFAHVQRQRKLLRKLADDLIVQKSCGKGLSVHGQSD